MPKRRLFPFLVAFVSILFVVLAACKSGPPAEKAGGAASLTAAGAGPGAKREYADLLALWKEFREYQKPRATAGVPDYTAAAMSAQKARIAEFQGRLAAFDTTGWPVAQRVDFEIVRAEMNGLAFDHRVLRPWSRDPTFYAVIEGAGPDVPGREGAQVFGCLCLADYKFPLAGADVEAVREKLSAIPGLLAQAKVNLVEDARDLTVIGIRLKKDESASLESLAKRLSPANADLAPLARKARAAVDDFRSWLEQRLPSQKAPSGVGQAEFDWYQKYVHLVPFTWDEQLSIVQRELDRALAYLKLEEHRNRRLPPLPMPRTRDEQQARMKKGVAEFFAFLKKADIFTVLPEMTLSDRVGPIVPPERRDFFSQIEYRDVLPLRAHSVHWLEKAREKHNAHPLRGTPLLYNIWDSRAEGFATAFEEMMMGAGMMDRNPRSRELVYVLLAFRAVRAMCDLMIHAGRWTLDDAFAYAAKTTPYGWVKPDSGTIWTDLRIYFHQPGYGTSYVVGKVQVEQLMADYARLRGEPFVLKTYMEEMFSKGIIPQSLIRWEMTGLDDEMKKLWK